MLEPIWALIWLHTMTNSLRLYKMKWYACAIVTIYQLIYNEHGIDTANDATLKSFEVSSIPDIDYFSSSLPSLFLRPVFRRFQCILIYHCHFRLFFVITYNELLVTINVLVWKFHYAPTLNTWEFRLRGGGFFAISNLLRNTPTRDIPPWHR